MAAETSTPAPAEPEPPPPPLIHEAELASGPTGAVIRGAVVDLTTAVARRLAGLNVVVCGDDHQANSALAQRIEAAVGPYKRGVAHRNLAGPRALPHFQQQARTHLGHTFYETANRRAARRQP
jgi:hypothetical protein